MTDTQPEVTGDGPTLAGLRPECLKGMIRLGRDCDGGYVINSEALRSSRLVISFGLGEDWSFEADFLKRKPGLKVLCFDHSVSSDVFLSRMRGALDQIMSVNFECQPLLLRQQRARQMLDAYRHAANTYSGFQSFCSAPGVSFFNLGISDVRGERFVTFADVFELVPPRELLKDAAFVKMDIEQSEYRVLPQFLGFQQYVNGMVVEFHDLDVLWPNFMQLMNDLRTQFEVTHIHGNNWGRLIPGSRIPSVLEVTLLKRNLIREGQKLPGRVIYPIPGLDFPNDRAHEDYHLDL